MTRARKASEWRSVRVRQNTDDRRRSATSSQNLREIFRTERRRRKTSTEIISPWADHDRPLEAQKITMYSPTRHREDSDYSFEPSEGYRARSSGRMSPALLLKLFVLMNLMMIGLIIGAIVLR